MSRYERVPLDELMVDPSYQRVLEEKRVNKIVAEFDPALLGVLEVSLRNGKAAIFDGQHRFAALQRRGAKDAPCLIHEGLTVAEEAMLFVDLQTRRKALRPLDRFKARIVAGDESAISITRIAHEHGYVIAEGANSINGIGAVAALDRIYDRGGSDLLSKTLELVSVYRGEPKGTDGSLLEGLAIAIERYGKDRRMEKLPGALEQITAASIVRKGVAMIENTGGSYRSTAISKVILSLIGIRGPNKKRESTR